jgi:inner membrane protein
VLYAERNGANWQLDRLDLLLFMVFANIPDLDFLPGFFAGNPNMYHHGMTHSIFFALVVSIVVGVAYSIIRKKEMMKMSIILFVTYASHLLLDFLGKDTRQPFGEQLFWPFTSEYYISPFALFSDVHKASHSDIFLKSLFNWHNLTTMAIEVAILTPILLLVLNRKKQSL